MRSCLFLLLAFLSGLQLQAQSPEIELDHVTLIVLAKNYSEDTITLYAWKEGHYHPFAQEPLGSEDAAGTRLAVFVLHQLPKGQYTLGRADAREPLFLGYEPEVTAKSHFDNGEYYWQPVSLMNSRYLAIKDSVAAWVLHSDRYQYNYRKEGNRSPSSLTIEERRAVDLLIRTDQMLEEQRTYQQIHGPSASEFWKIAAPLLVGHKTYYGQLPNGETYNTYAFKQFLKQVNVGYEPYARFQIYYHTLKRLLTDLNEALPSEQKALIEQLLEQAPKEGPLNYITWKAIVEAIAQRPDAERYLDLCERYLARHYGMDEALDEALILRVARYKQPLKEGTPAPEFKATTLDGRPFDWASLRGKYVVLDFWPALHPKLESWSPKDKLAMHQQYKDQNVTFVSIYMGEDEAAWRERVAQYGWTWPQLSELQGTVTMTTLHYGRQLSGSIVLLDPEGRIVHPNLSGRTIGDILNKLLKE